MNEGARLVTLTERLSSSSEAVYGTEGHELVHDSAEPTSRIGSASSARHHRIRSIL